MRRNACPLDAAGSFKNGCQSMDPCMEEANLCPNTRPRFGQLLGSRAQQFGVVSRASTRQGVGYRRN